MADKSPAFQFYPKDFLTDDAVLSMTHEQIGAYVLLLCHAWLSEGLSPNLAVLAKIVHAKESRFKREIWPGISSKFFPNAEGRLINARMEKVRAEQAEYRERRANSGKKGAAQRWQSHSTAIEVPMRIDSPSPAPSPAPSIKKNKDTAADAASDGFSEFWLCYPRKDNRKDAEKAWKALKPINGTKLAILADVQSRLRSEQWTKERGKFIPMGGSYLRAHRWEDQGVVTCSASEPSEPNTWDSICDLLETRGLVNRYNRNLWLKPCQVRQDSPQALIVQAEPSALGWIEKHYLGPLAAILEEQVPMCQLKIESHVAAETA